MTAGRFTPSQEQTSGADENSIIPGAVTRRFVDLAQSMRGEPHDEGRDRLPKGQHSRTGTERIGARCKNRGKLGLRNPIMQSKAFRRRLQVRAAAALGKAAMERAEAHRVHIEWALSRPGLDGKPISFRGAGGKLNELQIPSPMGGRVSPLKCADFAERP